MKGQYFSICNELLKLPHFYIMPWRKRKQCYLYFLILVNCGTLLWHSELPATSGRWHKNATGGAGHCLSRKDSFAPLGSPRDPSSVTLRHPWGLPGAPPIWPRDSPRVTPVGSWGDLGVPQGDTGGVSGWPGGETMWVLGWHRSGHGVTLQAPQGDLGGTPGWHRRLRGWHWGDRRWATAWPPGSQGDMGGISGSPWGYIGGVWVTPAVAQGDTSVVLGWPWGFLGWHWGGFQGDLGVTPWGSWGDTWGTSAGSWIDHWVSLVVLQCDTRGLLWWHQGSLRVTPGWQHGDLGLTSVGSWGDSGMTLWGGVSGWPRGDITAVAGHLFTSKSYTCEFKVCISSKTLCRTDIFVWKIILNILSLTKVAKITVNSHLVAEDEAKAHLTWLQKCYPGQDLA